MKQIKPITKWILSAIGILLILLILKIFLFWTAKPKVTVDYLAQYNKITHPDRSIYYDESENADKEYQIAILTYVEKPPELQNWFYDRPKDANGMNANEYFKFLTGGRTKSDRLKDINDSNQNPFEKYTRYYNTVKIDWPTDLDDANQITLSQWMISNEMAFKYFRIASRKPYYWLERYTRGESSMGGMLIPEIAPLRDLTYAIIWNAKLQAAQGNSQSAFEDLLACYRAGKQKCCISSLMVDQILGSTIIDMALSASISIIDRVDISPQVLKDFDNSVQSIFDENSCFPDFTGEKLMAYDMLQKTFVYTRSGNGRLAWCMVKDSVDWCGGENFKLRKKLFLYCLKGPTYNEMIRHIEDTYAAYDSAKLIPPWQLKLKDAAFLQILVYPHCSNCDDFNYDDHLIYDFYSPYNLYYQIKAKEVALLAIISIHRYKADKGTLPKTLDELVSTGYLQSVPLDPYSDGPLIYRIEGGNFTLYSIGRNFKEDEGKIPQSYTLNKFNDADFSGDIIFWPVKRTSVKQEKSGQENQEKEQDANMPSMSQ